MNAFPRRARCSGSGYSWPNSPSAVGDIEEPFAPRPYAAHIATIGYDYDLHVGLDVHAVEGAPIYATMNGALARHHMSHFGFEDASQLDHLVLSAPSSSLAMAAGTNVLSLTCARVGVVTLANADKIRMLRERVNPTAADWSLEVQLNATISTVGTIGIGVFNPASSEYVAIEYDGSTITVRGIGTATFTANATTYAVSGKTWLRIVYVQSTNTFTWKHSTTGALNDWTTIATESGRAFTVNAPNMIPTLYWKSGDTNASSYTIDVSTFNLADEGLSVGRFGNWGHVSNASEKGILVHFRTLTFPRGSFISAGQLIGYAGLTGYDDRSGRISSEHLHYEHQLNRVYEYSRANSINPLAPGIFPRTNVSNNVTVPAPVTANDPDGFACWKLSVSVARADQDFDLNGISLTSNLATRSLNLNTRAGLNTTDVDIPKSNGGSNGMYLVPGSFTEASSAYTLDVFFLKSVVGTSTPTYSVTDTAGTVLASG